MNLNEKSINQLLDLKQFVGKVSDEQYTENLPDLSQASLGQHVRHILEFYSCLLKASEQKPVVCYDERERDKNLENNTGSAIELIESIVTRLETRVNDFTIQLKSLINEGKAIMVESSLEREMWYVYEHTTHHMAILKIGAFLLGINQVGTDFGVADSTIEYRKRVNY